MGPILTIQTRYLYVCGSVSVFDSVISGIRKAIYNFRTATMESTDVILDTAFAERRFMLDVFMTPKPLPCNIPTIPLSQLAMNTAHRKDGRLWIAVHGKVYDVTDFCPMHPGGTNIIKSNAGVDCSKSFDILAHTNNPEVSSLLNKYFIGEFTPKPNYHHNEEISMLYDLWASYLRTAVETLVASHFEVNMIMEGADVWFQGNLFNMGGVRRFYHYQSRLLQGGFSALFGAKLEELCLKLSFTLASAASGATTTRLPDVLGIVTRAKTSSEAIATSNEVSQMGQFTCNSDAARFHEKGILNYARKSVELDMELLEDIREEACRGMDAFDTVMDLEAQSDSQRVVALATFLLQIMERMANRLAGFYSKLAQYSINQPEMERNPARTRWNLLRRRIRDGSFFVLAQKVVMGGAPTYMPQRGGQDAVEFDRVISQIQRSLHSAPKPITHKMGLTEQHVARAQTTQNGSSALESHEAGHAMKRMSTFMNDNMRAIRRLSRMPTNVSLEQLMTAYGPAATGMPTPPGSRSSSRSPSSAYRMQSMDAHMNGQGNLNLRRAPSSAGSVSRLHTRTNTGLSSESMGRPSGQQHLTNFAMVQQHQQQQAMAARPISAAAAMSSLMSKMNVRARPNGMPSPPESIDGDRPRALQMNGRPSHSMGGSVDHHMDGGMHTRTRSSTNSSLRAFKLSAGDGMTTLNRRGTNTNSGAQATF